MPDDKFFKKNRKCPHCGVGRISINTRAVDTSSDQVKYKCDFCRHTFTRETYIQSTPRVSHGPNLVIALILLVIAVSILFVFIESRKYAGENFESETKFDVSVSGSNVIIENLGVKSIPSNSLEVFVDGKKIRLSNPEIKPGKATILKVPQLENRTDFTVKVTTKSEAKVINSSLLKPTLSFNANPTTITQGQSTTLEWSAINALSCIASGGWSGSKPTIGAEPVSPTQVTMYALNCSAGKETVLKSVTVEVLPFEEQLFNITPQVSLESFPCDIEELQAVGFCVPDLTPKLEYVKGQVIVKFKSNVKDIGKAAESLNSLITPVGTNYITSVKPIFPQFVAKINPDDQEQDVISKRTKLFSDIIKSINESHPQIAKRAPKGAVVPNPSTVYLINLSEDVDIEKAVSLWTSDGNIEYAHLNYIADITALPNDVYVDPDQDGQWSKGAWGQSYEDLWGLKIIESDKGWEKSQGEGIVVAVIDTGVDYNHVDIAANIWVNPCEDLNGNGQVDQSDFNNVDDACPSQQPNGYIDDIRGWDFVNNDNDPMDDSGHGTHVAGTIAAVGNNNKGVIGVAPKARIMILKGLSDIGSGYVDDLAKAITYAAQNGADIISNSWGCGSPCPSLPMVEESVQFAYGMGVVVLFSAGNNRDDVINYSPQNMVEVIVVGATNMQDQYASFTNYGDIDVLASGVDILSLKSGTNIMPQNLVVSEYIRLTGTSMSTPHASGVAALILKANPQLSSEQVRQAIRSGDRLPLHKIPVEGFVDKRLNAQKSLAVLSPLEVLIVSPSMNNVLKGESVNIYGLVVGPDFESWKLEYTKSRSFLGDRTTIVESRNQVSPSGLLATLDLKNLPDGEYLLRLTAKNTKGEVYEDTNLVVVDNVFISEPPSNSYFGSQVITFKGSANTPNLAIYTIKIKTSDDKLLENPAISLANNGLKRVNNGVLGTWDATNLPPDWYTVYIYVTLADGSTFLEKGVSIIVHPRLHTGWPKNLGIINLWGSFRWGFINHVNVADIDLNGQMDILVAYGNSLRIFDHAGNMLKGWPQSLGNDPTLTQISPAVGDLTGDNSPEVALSSFDGNLFVWNADGTVVSGWPKVKKSYFLSIDDINGDGKNEIIATIWKWLPFGNVYEWSVDVIDMEGRSLTGWPKIIGSGPPLGQPAIAIADIDGNGKKEIAATVDRPPTNLYIFSFDGKILPGWPKAINPNLGADIPCDSSPSFGDLDNDGDLEVVIGACRKKVYAFHHDGTDVPSWPEEAGDGIIRTPVIGDIDGDGHAEVVVSTLIPDKLYAWKGNGKLLDGWPKENFKGFFAGTTSRVTSISPILADVNDDGKADVIGDGYDGIVVSKGSTSRFAFLAYASNEPTIFPTNSFISYDNAPAVADLDGDGLLEMVGIDFDMNMYVWDLPSRSVSPLPWPMLRHDARNTASLGPDKISLECSISTLCDFTTVFKMSSLADAHVEIPTSSNYDYSVCCKAERVTLSNSCIVPDVVPLHLSGATDAHVEKGTLSNFNVNVCLSATPGTISCSHKTGCNADETCLATISSDTDAHVSDCAEHPFPTKICCKLS